MTREEKKVLENQLNFRSEMMSYFSAHGDKEGVDIVASQLFVLKELAEEMKVEFDTDEFTPNGWSYSFLKYNLKEE